MTGVRRFLQLLVALVLVLAGLSMTPAHAGGDKDCSDFDTQRQAQNFFEDHNPSEDPHQLDADGDGIACESNPCPCSTGGGGGGDGGGGSNPDPVKKDKARVLRVIDGDTVKVNLKPGPKATIRVLGIDTPEVYGGEECHGPEASNAMKRTLPRGTIVRLRSDPSQDLKDRYGRRLRYIAEGQVDVGRRMVRRGHARVYVYNDNPFKRVKTYRKAQRAANDQDLGLWGHC